jgi:putative zinc finger/helix-turn-helix YgiT family protein
MIPSSHCLNCHATSATECERCVSQHFKEELYGVVTPVLVCNKCGAVRVGLHQVDELRKRTADAYRKKHNLMTGDEIKSLREGLTLNHREFAVLIGVDDVTVRRWETWLVQREADDEKIIEVCYSKEDN